MKSKACNSACLIAVLLLVCIHSVFAQFDDWSIPVPVSDSIADNRNAVIKEVIFNDEWGNFIFWERSADSGSTDIYCRNLYMPEEPVVVVTGGDFLYTNPQVISTYNYVDDTLFFLFYQSNQNGNADIYYKIYTYDGFSDPILFAGTQADETHFRCNDSGLMTWQEGDKIMTRQLIKDYYHPYFTFTDPVTLDSPDCAEPEIPYNDISGDYPYVTWLKPGTDSTSVWYSYRLGETWSEPVLLTGPGINSSAGFAKSPCPGNGLSNFMFSWDNLAGNEHTIHAWLSEDNFFESDFHQESPFMPEFVDYVMPVENFNEMGYLTFVFSDGQNSDIYANDFFEISPYLENYSNISDSPYPETNPKFFNGQCPIDLCDLVLIWESYRNNHWQLFYSLTEVGCYGNIADTPPLLSPELNISPNPTHGECDINYTLPADENISLSFCTPDGRQIVLIDQKYCPKGDYTYHLDIFKILPGHFSGMLIIRLTTPASSINEKLMIIR